MRGSIAFAAQAAVLALAAAGPASAAQDDAPGHPASQSCQGPPDPPGLAAGLERRCPAIRGSSGIARGDFNGDGIADLAIGAPGVRLRPPSHPPQPAVPTIRCDPPRLGVRAAVTGGCLFFSAIRYPLSAIRFQ